MATDKPVRAANIRDFQDKKSLIIKTPEGEEAALFYVDGKVYALNNTCPHMGGPLAEGDLENRVVTCPWHGWQFNIATGECENMPGEDVRCYRVEVTGDGEIFLTRRNGADKE